MNENSTGSYRHSLASFMNILDAERLFVSAEGDVNILVEYLSFDTRDMKPGTLFFCKGIHFREGYLAQAAELGAVAYVSEKKYDFPLPCILVSDVRRAMSVCALFHYGYPAERLITVGITGTKGKTTTSFFVKAALDDWMRAQDKPETAIISSVAVYDGVERRPSRITTPEAIELQRYIATAADCEVGYLTMEVSSQGIKYLRSEGIKYDVGCMLNIGYDHISSVEHPDFEDYFHTKLKLFDVSRIAVLNRKMERYEEVVAYIGGRIPIVTVGGDPSCDVYGYNARKEGDFIVFTAKTADFEREFRISTPGFFNVDNALAAIAICRLLGVPPENIAAGILNTRVDGRMDLHRSRDGKLNAIVDFAHNRMSFEALALSVRREYPDKKIVFVFGCPGMKAYNRRRDLGEAAGYHSDFIYITEDDTGEEPFEKISSEIAGFVKATGCPYKMVEDREEAIRTALKEMGEESVILIVGKGCETNQRTADGYKDYITDAGAVDKYLAEYDARTAVLEVKI